MAKVKLRAYTSPTLILLAMDWPEGAEHADFLGFAIRRTPGFRGAAASWLTNRIGFDGPPADGSFLPSDKAPIQKFMWWDAQIDTADRGKKFRYEVWPVRGTRDNLARVDAAMRSIQVTLPRFVEGKIGTWFNRAVVSSQAFSRLLKDLDIATAADLTEAKERKLRTWLANGLETVIPDFLETTKDVSGAVYHLEDRFWVRPALAARQRDTALVYDARKVYDSDTKKYKDSPNLKVVEELEEQNDRLVFHPRTKARIMHNKLLAEVDGTGKARRVLCGSANFTSGGLATQANLLHVLDSPALAGFYLERITALQGDPKLATLAKIAKWSDWTTVDDAEMRVCFAPEKKDKRVAIGPIIEAIRKAKSSVVFCLFTPTDRELRNECFDAGDRGLMMFGLVNLISQPKNADAADGTGETLRADELARVELFHRSRNKKDVVGAGLFRRDEVPAGFLRELKTLPGSGGGKIPPVIIHHKFVVIDAEGDKPVIFTGSANMSNNSQYNNDENVLHIRGSKRLAAAYLAEFMRLYEHYRARADWARRQAEVAAGNPAPSTFRLTPDAAWAKKHFRQGSPEARARQAMAD
jgi:phosphatidylserine/phosphatidylglycerophosphate/cardiolipin synthase-like enzyme